MLVGELAAPHPYPPALSFDGSVVASAGALFVEFAGQLLAMAVYRKSEKTYKTRTQLRVRKTYPNSDPR